MSPPDLVYNYNTLDQLVNVIKGSGVDAATISMEYDAAGRKTAISDPDMGNWTYAYDALGNFLTQTDARGCVTTMLYDALNRLTSKTFSGAGACDSTADITYAYDSGSYGIGRRTAMSDGTGSTAWAYDARGRVSSETKIIDANTYTTAWGYNSADLPLTQTLPDGEVLTYGYDSQGAPTTLTGSNGSSFTYVKNAWYDEAGRITNLKLGDSNGNAVITRQYGYYSWSTATNGGKLHTLLTTNSASATLQNLTYAYNANANITSIADARAGETSAFSYDALNRLTANTVTDSSNVTAFSESFAYDAGTGSLASKNGLAFTYDSLHKHAVAAYDNGAYSYDANGNQTVRDLADALFELVYDAQNRLIEVQSNQPFTTEEVNWDGVTPTATPTITQTPIQTSTPTETLPPTATPTASETSIATPTPTASETPTETETPTPSATWDGTATLENNPIETATPTITDTPTETFTPTITLTPSETSTATETPIPTEMTTPSPTATATPAPQGGIARYYYDGDGNMVKSVIDDVTTYYPSASYQVKTNGTYTNTRKYYSFNGAAVAMRENDVISWLLQDQVNSTTITADANGILLSETRYSAFGEIRYANGATVTDKLYTGQQQEVEIGLSYYVARFYDPVIAHFIQPDSLIPQASASASYDRYAYVNGNPINFNDPSGNRACDDNYGPECRVVLKQPIIYTDNTPTPPNPYNGIAAAEWAIENQQTKVSCWGSSTCTCFVSTAINEGARKEILKPNTEEFNRTPSFYDYLTSGEDYNVPSLKYFDTQNAPPYNLTSATWKAWLQENMPQPGDIILYHNALNNLEYSHAAMVVGYSAEGWPLVVDQSNGNQTIAQPHDIDETSSADIWDIAIIYFSKWKGE